MSIRYVAKQYNIPSGTIFTRTERKNHPKKVTEFKRERKNDSNLTTDNSILYEMKNFHHHFFIS